MFASGTVVHEGGVLVVGLAGVAGKGGNGEEEWVDSLKGFLLGLAEDVSHDHAALSIGVTNADTTAGARGDDFVGDVAVGADGVADESKKTADTDVSGLEDAQGLEETSNGGSTSLVAGHTSHVATDLEVSTAGVHGDALADEEDGGVFATLTVVLEVHDATIVTGNTCKEGRKSSVIFSYEI